MTPPDSNLCHWPSPTAGNDAERKLINREAARLVDVVQGRADTRTAVCHYLIIERMDLGNFVTGRSREIEQYRDLERVVFQAADCETGDRLANWIGAFTATYVDGKLASVAMVEDMPALVSAERGKRPEDRLRPVAGIKNMLRPSSEELATGLEAAAAAGLRAEARR